MAPDETRRLRLPREVAACCELGRLSGASFLRENAAVHCSGTIKDVLSHVASTGRRRQASGYAGDSLRACSHR